MRVVQVIAVAACVLLGLGRAAAQVIEAPEPLNFSFEAPEGFVPDLDLPATNTDILYAFRKGPIEAPDLVLFVEALRGMIGREPLQASDLPAGSDASLLSLRWQGLDIQGIVIREDVDGLRMATYVAPVPIRPRAVRVTVIGPALREMEVRAALDSFLAGLSGETNWTEEAGADVEAGERARVGGGTANRTGSTGRWPLDSYGTFLLVAVVVGLVVGLVIVWAVRPWLPRGGVLAIAAGLFAIGCMLPTGTTRTGLAASGSLRLFSIAVGVIGLFDVCRTRRTRVVVKDDRGWGEVPPGPA